MNCKRQLKTLGSAREWKPSVRNTFHRLYSAQLLIKWFGITTFKSRAFITGSKPEVHIWPSMSKMVVFHLLTVNKRDRRVILCTWMYFHYLKVAAVVDFSLQPQRKKMFMLLLKCVLSLSVPLEQAWSGAGVPQSHLREVWLWTRAACLTLPVGFQLSVWHTSCQETDPSLV